MSDIMSALSCLQGSEWLIAFIVSGILVFVGIQLVPRASALFKKSAACPDHTEEMKLEAWHSKDIQYMFELSETTHDGLSEEEASRRLGIHGLNRLPETKAQGMFVRFLCQFHNVLIYVLIIAGVVTFMLDHWLDAGVIMAVVFMNAVIGFVQEGKAENALRAIRHMLSPSAMVMRNARQLRIPAEQLVPGDVVLLQSGDKVPADLRLFRVKGLRVQEAALTGESIAIEKNTNSVDQHADIGDRYGMAYSGTLVSHGQGSGVVVATGAQTELGHISTLVADVESVTTPLLRQISQFARWLTAAILLIALLNFVFGVLVRDYAAAEMFMASVSLAVAAIPEGLPAIMTITLAMGVQRMARRHAIIRKLPAVETLGAVSVICSDKTGTLTRNEMTVRSIVDSVKLFKITGTGYDPHGVVMIGSTNVQADENPCLMEVLRGALLCNDASVERKNQHESEYIVHGDPMEGALLIAGLKVGFDIEEEAKKFPRTDLIPFESEHQFMATLHHNHMGDGFIFLKGAPERVLEMCAYQRGENAEQALEKKYWLQRIKELAEQGQRVLAIAVKPAHREQMELRFADVESGLTLLGMCGLIDPPRTEAIDSIRTCEAAGIRVKMITGDHAMTAGAIARQLNLVNVERVLTGRELDQMTEEELMEQVLKVDVYARVSPEHKLRLVRLLQQQGLIVAMTGDGVNDAPALKRADVGTAMGKNGTEAAREAAEMVLADDDFSSIAHAVKEGRIVYDNLKKAILFILPTNGGEALIILAAILSGFHQLPLTPVQILWVNMITAVTLALALAFEPAEKNVMSRPPVKASEPLLNAHLIWRIAFVSVILMSGTFGLFLWDIEQGATIEHARTVAVNTLVMFEIFYLFNSRYIHATVFSWAGFTENRYVLIAIGILILFQLAFTYLMPMQLLFGTEAIGFNMWVLIALVSSSVLFLVELEKFFMRRCEFRKRCGV